jgi:5-methylcytosine-specific restriction endonuclease McrA
MTKDAPNADRDRSEWRTKWNAYLQSPEWALLREQVLERFGRRCAICNAKGALSVHHRTYERAMHEDVQDLTALCSACHKLFSKRLAPDGPNGWKPYTPQATARHARKGKGAKWVAQRDRTRAQAAQAVERQTAEAEARLARVEATA